MTHPTNSDIDATNAENELLAMHHLLLLMPGDPGPSVPMVVRMGAVIARLKEDRSKQYVADDTHDDKLSTVAVDDCPTSSHPTTTAVLTNVSGLILVELEPADPCSGMAYVATKAPFASLDEAVAFLRQHPHEDIPQNKDMTLKNMRVVMAVDECLLPSDLIAEAFHVAQTDCVIGSW
jgi:hypothetical protein